MADFNQKPICPHNEFCGGCIYQEKPYEEQALLKGKEVAELMRKKGADLSRLSEPFRADDLVRAPQLYEYRSKMEYTFGDMKKGGEMTLGMHQKGRFMNIVTVDECQLVHPDFNLILRTVLDFCNEKGYPKYNAKTHLGLMRNLIIRWGQRTGELLVNIVTTSDSYAGIAFDEAGFAAADMLGSQCNDCFRSDNNGVTAATNNNGGILGGITTGLPILFRTALKPTPSIFKEQQTIDLNTLDNTTLQIKGRHDPAIVHRARVVADSVTALVLCDQLAMRFGTDWLKA